MADFELPTILSQIGSFVCSCEVGVQLQQCMLLYDMCANNSINSDERSRAHSYSVQQQSPVSSQWACELVQQVQKILYPSIIWHMVDGWCAMSATKITGSFFNFMRPYIHTNMLYTLSHFWSCVWWENRSLFLQQHSQQGWRVSHQFLLLNDKETQPLKLLGFSLHML